MNDQEILELIANPEEAKKRLNIQQKEKAVVEKKRKAEQRERKKKMKPIEKLVKEKFMGELRNAASTADSAADNCIDWIKMQLKLEPDEHGRVHKYKPITPKTNLDQLFDELTEWDELQCFYSDNEVASEFGYQLESIFEELVKDKLRKILSDIEEGYKQAEQDKANKKFWSGKKEKKAALPHAGTEW